MSLKDEDHLKFEADFKGLVEKYIEFLSLYNQLLLKPNLTPDEEIEFQVIKQLLLNICDVLSTTLKTLSDELFGKALDLYYYYKGMALQGDNDARSLVNELKPMFANSLRSRISMN